MGCRLVRAKISTTSLKGFTQGFTHFLCKLKELGLGKFKLRTNIFIFMFQEKEKEVPCSDSDKFAAF